jgi:hypothetical protein
MVHEREARPPKLWRRCRRPPQLRDGHLDSQAQTRTEVAKQCEALLDSHGPILVPST